jgi:hypothetical protein
MPKAVDLFAVFAGAGKSLGLDSAVNSRLGTPQSRAAPRAPTTAIRRERPLRPSCARLSQMSKLRNQDDFPLRRS